MLSQLPNRLSLRRVGVALVLALVTGIAMGIALPAAADTRAIDFEAPTYSPGSIQGQDGWGGSGTPINPTYDQGVVATSGFGSPVGFGAQSFRMSNAVTSGSFGDWVFSPSLTDAAGETSAVSNGFSGGTRKTHFVASLEIASAVSSQLPGLQISLSPDRGDGARMSFLRLRDTSAGLDLDFADYESGVNEPGCPTGDNFVTTEVASALDRSVPHSLRLSMIFVDGTENDIVRVFVDGALKHTGTSWEDFFRECEGNPTRPVDSMIFQARSGGGTAPGTLGNGFLIDNLELRSFSTGTFDPCLVDVSGSSPTTYTLLADCVTDHTIVVPQRAGGSVFDGNGYSITGVDPSAGHFLGAVVQGMAGSNDITVKNLEVTVDGLSDVCDPGADRLRGILFDGVGGVIRDNTVTEIRQGTNSGCQEGNGIEVRNEPFEKGGVDESVVIRDNEVTGYQKTGILANGSVSAAIRGNTVEGDGAADYIAQNGIQVGFAATARLFGNEASLNNYTPRKVTACGLLLFKADGVGGETKSGIKHVRAENDFHANEQNICNFGKGGTFKPAT